MLLLQNIDTTVKLLANVESLNEHGDYLIKVSYASCLFPITPFGIKLFNFTYGELRKVSYKDDFISALKQ